MKYYAVRAGREVGVFESWADCQTSITGYSGAEYKSFNTKEEAEAYLNNVDIALATIKTDIEKGYTVAFCDGSFDKDRNRYSYGVIVIDSDLEEHEICGSASNPKYVASNNIIGEILGTINALDWALSNNCEKIKIYHDYEGLSKWISGEWEAKSEVAKMLVNVYEKKFAGLLQVKFEKVAGHSNNKYNDKADELAKRALSDNARVPIKGDSWFSIPYFKAEDLQAIIDLISENHPDIEIEKDEKSNSIIYRLKLEGKRLSVTLFKSGNKKLLVQGANTIVFQVFITYVYELTEANADRIIGDAYRQNIDTKKIDEGVQCICPTFPADYPQNIKPLVRQSIINLSYYVQSEDYSQYVFPALRALEGHMKYLFSKANIQIVSKNGFCHFRKHPGSSKYYLPTSIVSDATLRNKLEVYYNFYNVTRHTLFHFGDIIGGTDSTRIIDNKGEADGLIRRCLQYIREE